MNKRKRAIGRVTLTLGILTLIAAVLVAFSIGTIAAPILLFSSIALNSLGITLLRGGRR